MLEIPDNKRERSALPARQGGLDTNIRFAAKTGDQPQRVQRRRRKKRKIRRCDTQAGLATRIRQAGQASTDQKFRTDCGLVADKLEKCGNVPLPRKDPKVKGKEDNQRHFAGMCHCSKALCPNCLPYADSKRVEKLGARAAGVAQMEGVRHFLLTVTLRHHYGALWLVLVVALKAVWRVVGKSRFWREAVAGFAWKLETTFSQLNGHHPHIHCLVTLKKGVDADAFAARLKETWERELRLLGRTCEWRDGWWQPLPESDDLERTVKYIGKGFKEVLGTSGKNSAPWNLPVPAFVEIFLSMNQVKWFGTGGCWRTAETKKAESEEALNAERENDGVTLLTIPAAIWNNLPYELRFNIRSLIANDELTHEQCIDQILSLLAAQGTS